MRGRTTLPTALLFVAALAGGCATAPPAIEDPLTDARKRLAKDPDNVRLQVELAELSFQKRDYLRARQYLALAEESVVRGLPSEIDSQRLFQLGLLIAIHGQQYSDAIRRCQQKLELDTDDVRTRLLLASLLEAVGDELGAERQWRMLIALRPDEPHYLFEAARFYERTGRTDRKQLAQRLYARYLELAPGGPEVAQVRAALLAQEIDQRTGRE